MIILVGGAIASGKSTVSQGLSSQLGWPVYGFGNFVRALAEKIGLDGTDRDTLQDLGAVLVKRPERFCRGFLEWVGSDSCYIVDGIRHKTIVDALRKSLSPESSPLVFVDAPEEVTRERHRLRRDGEDLDRVRNHLVESQINDLRNYADFIVSGYPDNNLEALIASQRH